MKRRSFLSNTAIATVGITSLSLTGCNTNEKEKTTQTNDPAHFELDEETITSLQEKMVSGKYSSEALVRLYLKRIEDIDRNGPKLNSIIELNPDALSIAKAMDDERKNGKIRGQLHGIPILIKDNINTADKMQTTAGALALEGNIAPKDAFIVERLRSAGAVIIGKTNLSEWANFRSTKSSSGWSSRGGQTRNPYSLDKNPCGSSSGSGAAVAANLCTVAVGTETDGSVVCPASVNGIVGLKPTVGLVSRSGIIPISKTQDTAGPMARTVKDVAILLSALAGVDSNDSVSGESVGKFHADYTQFLDMSGLKGKRIGVEKSPTFSNGAMDSLSKDAIDLLKSQGATIVEIEYLKDIGSAASSELEVLLYEFKAGVNDYLASSNAKVKTLADVIKFNQENESKAMPFFKQGTLERANAAGPLSDKKYLDAVNKSHIYCRNILDNLFKDHQLDAICGLTMGTACSIDEIYGDHYDEYFLTMPAAVSGYPHITVPCGMTFQLPIGFSFFGAAYDEPKMLAMAYAFEQASKKREKPQFRPHFS